MPQLIGSVRPRAALVAMAASTALPPSPSPSGPPFGARFGWAEPPEVKPMSSEAAFLAAVREDPAGDTPRLVLADWLEDRGDSTGAARAELIRVQCELSLWVPDLRRRTELQEREQQLLARHGEDWLGALRPFCRSWRFERGLARGTIDARRFVGKRVAAQAGALPRAAPVAEMR